MSSVLRMLAILAASVLAGTIQRGIAGYPWIPDVEAVKKRLEGKSELERRHEELRATVGASHDEFMRAMAEGAIIIDARPATEFEKGHLAGDGPIPVLNVEPEKFQENLERILPLQGQPIFIYCTSLTCELGEELYLEMEKAGFFGMKIYFPGWEALEKAGVSTAAGPDTWTMESSTDMSAPTEEAHDAANDPAESDPPAEQP